MKKYILIILVISIINTLFGETVKIWKNTELRRTKSEMYIFYPDADKNNHTAVIICPGGSYCYLGIRQEGYEVAKKLTKQGFTAFVLRYRVGIAAHYPDMIQDLQRAIQLVRQNAQQYNIDEEKVGIMGFSAGGHLAGTAATYFNENFMETLGIKPQVSLKPYFTVMIYPVVTMRNLLAHQKSRKSLLGAKPAEELLYKMSLEENVHNNMQNLLILQAKDDKTVDYQNSVILSNHLTQKNINHKFILYNTGGHGFGALPKAGTEFAVWFDDFLKWHNEIKQ
ncbi:MAG: alpha/beta hydrolase [Bacteroidetes bacterium]|nr:alpha/beta hydrolase [Bacteroidota bacterium]